MGLIMLSRKPDNGIAGQGPHLAPLGAENIGYCYVFTYNFHALALCSPQFKLTSLEFLRVWNYTLAGSRDHFALARDKVRLVIKVR